MSRCTDALGGLPPADGVILLDSHLGDAFGSLTYTDPSAWPEEYTFAVMVTVRSKPTFSKPAPDEIVDELIHASDIVVTGVGD